MSVDRPARSAEEVRRERRGVGLLLGLIAAVLVVALAVSMAVTAGEPRRGEGMIPPPEPADEAAGDGAAPGEDAER